MSAPYPRPAPIGAHDARFWSFAAQGELRIQRCADCGVHRHPPRPLCAACGSTAVEWVAASGRGEIWARTVIHPPTLPAFTERTPYCAVVVRLDEGVFMVSTIVDRNPDDVVVAAPVELVLTEVERDLVLPLARVVDA
ncbi:MAG: Zn-ribbon domain-containing OB-fold protein [Actinobacteria bacterium]|nr:Zn-ribbon domain-containing OB-fold protein [Actinomycetota bacterium]